MEKDWVPPEPHGIERVGTDEDLIEREARQPDFEGEFGERLEAGPIERETPDDVGPR